MVTPGTARAAHPSSAERLARLALISAWIGIALLLVWLGYRISTGALPFTTRIDTRTGTAGLIVETDAGTGCDYLVTPWGGIVPRTGADGRQLCTPKP